MMTIEDIEKISWDAEEFPDVFDWQKELAGKVCERLCIPEGSDGFNTISKALVYNAEEVHKAAYDSGWADCSEGKDKDGWDWADHMIYFRDCYEEEVGDGVGDIFFDWVADFVNRPEDASDEEATNEEGKNVIPLENDDSVCMCPKCTFLNTLEHYRDVYEKEVADGMADGFFEWVVNSCQ